MDEDTGLNGRVVSVWSKDPAQGGVLENVCVRHLGGRAFLVGQLADDGKAGDPRAGATFWFPVDEVLMLTVYPDVHTARAAYAAREKQPAEDSPKRSGWLSRK